MGVSPCPGLEVALAISECLSSADGPDAPGVSGQGWAARLQESFEAAGGEAVGAGGSGALLAEVLLA